MKLFHSNMALRYFSEMLNTHVYQSQKVLESQ